MRAHKYKSGEDQKALPASDKALETELKFLFAPTELERILGAPALNGRPEDARFERLDATYFDTADRDLWKHGFSLRLRRSAKRLVQTVKRDMESGVQRREWECEITGPALDFAAIDGTPLGELTERREIRESLRPLFRVCIERMSFQLDQGATRIECAVDRGEIEAGGSKLPISELELELKGGDAAGLFDVARRLVQETSLLPSAISKAERGYLLARGSWGRSAKGEKLRLSAEKTNPQAFRSICSRRLHDFMLNEAAFSGDDRVEAVHQARVAIRRLRATISLFKPMVRDDAVAKIQDELRWLAGLLGAARDLDILCAKLRSPKTDPTARQALQPFADRLEAKRRRLYQEALNGARSARGRILLIELIAWIENGQWRAQPSDALEASLSNFIGGRLKKRSKKLKTLGADLANLGSEARHRVRIEAKKLRYMSEFFGDALDGVADRKEMKRFVQSLGDLQAALGEMHDEEAKTPFVEAETRAWRDEAGAHDEAAIAAAERWGAATADMDKELEKAVAAFKAFLKAEPF
ncbi:CYTH and CHAD domain-containing protein [Methylocapsa acidiphila]|uniref:CYTH and CHAD domain-containing protein n=1 Tax=Methylocapsa acidiphila TaxID=133552 RepID=UPI0004280999|nr:CYTH and CHAD domain-containing protein [Methylocapsa acidiphila]